MRFWHQSLTELDRLPAYRDAMAAHFQRVGRPDTVVDLHGMAPGTYATLYPGVDIRYHYVQALHSLQVLRNVQRAEREGYDGFLLMTLPEPVLEEARTLVDIPVVGYGQSSMHVAGMLGRRFAILAMITELVPLYESHIAKHGMSGKAWGVVPLGLEFTDIVAGFERAEPVLEHVRKLTRRLAADGVDAVIPGEAPVAALLSAAGLHRVDEVPIVDALGATLASGEMMATLARRSGQRMARTGYYTQRPPAGRLEELERYYRVDTLGERHGDPRP